MKGKPAKTARTPTIRRDTLDCVLNVHWFNEIKYGKKRTEYREIGQYWRSRIFAGKTPNAVSAAVEEKKTDARRWGEELKKQFIRFRRAYTPTCIYGRIDYVDVGTCPYHGWTGEYYRIHFTLFDELGWRVSDDGVLESKGSGHPKPLCEYTSEELAAVGVQES